MKSDGSSDAPLSRTVGPADCKGLWDPRRSKTSLAFLLAFHLALSNIRLILSYVGSRKRGFPKGAEEEDKVSGQCRLGREGSRLKTSNRGLIPCSFASIGSRLVVCKFSELQNEHVNHLSGSLLDVPPCVREGSRDETFANELGVVYGATGLPRGSQSKSSMHKYSPSDDSAHNFGPDEIRKRLGRRRSAPSRSHPGSVHCHELSLG